MKRFRLFEILLLAISLVSCSYTQKNETFKNEVTAGQCENAYLHIPENSSGLKFVRKSQEAAGTAFHYTATGAGYLAEYTAYVTAGVLIFVVACAPAALAGGSECIPVNAFTDSPSLGIPKLGKRTQKATAKWVCSDLDPLSQQIRQVASCFKNRGRPEDLRAARSTLINFRKSENVFSCLSADEKSQFLKDSDSISMLIAIPE